MDMIKKVLLVLVCCVAVAACDSSGQQMKNVGKYAPKVNPKPRHTLEMRVILDKKLQSLGVLHVLTKYHAENVACEVTTNALEGAKAYRDVVDVQTIHNVVRKNIKIAVDKYLPGYCSWKISSVVVFFMHSGRRPETMVSLIFENQSTKTFGGNKFSTVFICNNKECADQASPQYIFTKNLMRNKSYTYDLKVMRQDAHVKNN